MIFTIQLPLVPKKLLLMKVPIKHQSSSLQSKYPYLALYRIVLKKHPPQLNLMYSQSDQNRSCQPKTSKHQTHKHQISLMSNNPVSPKTLLPPCEMPQLKPTSF